MTIMRSKYYNAKHCLETFFRYQPSSNFINYVQYKTGGWGDTINPLLIQLLSNAKPREIDVKEYKSLSSHRRSLNKFYLMVGSTLQHADQQLIVWGAGFSAADLSFKETPKLICAVRGPLSRDRVISLGVECPHLWGDPLLLISKFYSPQSSPDYRLGIISHIADYPKSTLRRLIQNEEVLFIDTLKLSVKEVAGLICRCKKVVSTSLHGLVLADAYQVASAWIKNSKRSTAQDFKFHDYFASLGLYDETPLVLSPNVSLAQLEAMCRVRKIIVDLDALADSCPFRK
jgi:pyruvyltransferase